MRIYLAPMEGVTGHVFRRVHARCFGKADKYITPFLSPTQEKRLTHRELQEVLPAHNEGLPVVPQILTARAALFLWAAGELAAMGYGEVNLNLGCPSGTVVAKGKGAGFLPRRAELTAFLDEIFARCPLPISIKTRVGQVHPEEWAWLKELFARYPIAELTIHPRLGRELYGGRPRWELVAGMDCHPWPVCWSGDINSPEDGAALAARIPWVGAVMVGRGAVADPALLRRLSGGPPAAAEELRAFLSQLAEEYLAILPGRTAVLHKMKELWAYLGRQCAGQERWLKELRKARTMEQYHTAVAKLLTGYVPARGENVGDALCGAGECDRISGPVGQARREEGGRDVPSGNYVQSNRL